MQWAVIKTGGKQYKVAEGGFLKIEKLLGDFKKGDKVTFEEVLMTDDEKTSNVGTPFLKAVKVEGEIDAIGRNQKIDVIKYRQKSNYFKKRGHRQPFFKIKITKIA